MSTDRAPWYGGRCKPTALICKPSLSWTELCALKFIDRNPNPQGDCIWKLSPGKVIKIKWGHVGEVFMQRGWWPYKRKRHQRLLSLYLQFSCSLFYSPWSRSHPKLVLDGHRLIHSTQMTSPLWARPAPPSSLDPPCHADRGTQDLSVSTNDTEQQTTCSLEGEGRGRLPRCPVEAFDASCCVRSHHHTWGQASSVQHCLTVCLWVTVTRPTAP